MHPKSDIFHEISTFLESSQAASRKLLGCVGSVLECLRVPRDDFWPSLKLKQNVGKSKIFEFFFFEIFETTGVQLLARISFSIVLCHGYVVSTRREGSTCHPAR